MTKGTTKLEDRLKKCKTVRECFEVKNDCSSSLTPEQEIELRAKYAGLTITEAKCYESALEMLRIIENNQAKRKMEKLAKMVQCLDGK